MIQLNLLPDIKLSYIKAERTRNLVITASIAITAVVLAVLIILLLTDFVQKARISSLTGYITTQGQVLKNKPNINQILSVQNQIKSLPTLIGGEKNASALFSNYLDQITPQNVAINNINVDFTANTINLTGTANAITTINQYVDTLKDATYTSDKVTTPTAAFSAVVLSSFSVSNNSGSASTQAASYTINLNFDPNIFATTSNVNLSVPSKDTTRAQASDTVDLFEAAPATTKTGTGGN